MESNHISTKKDLQEQNVQNPSETPVRPEGSGKKKHCSALVAAAQYRSPVHHASSDTYFNTGLEDTGIGMGYREPREIT